MERSHALFMIAGRRMMGESTYNNIWGASDTTQEVNKPLHWISENEGEAEEEEEAMGAPQEAGLEEQEENVAPTLPSPAPQASYAGLF